LGNNNKNPHKNRFFSPAEAKNAYCLAWDTLFLIIFLSTDIKPKIDRKHDMEALNSHHIMVLFLSLGILLGTARILGELAQRFHQPSVLGELIAGVLLGPTVLGSLAPGVSEFIFPLQGPNAMPWKPLRRWRSGYSCW